jgi:ubiquinone/menaquinone biosynthesis C-methylase UbiE
MIERIVPGVTSEARGTYLAHVERYTFASRFVANKDVLDVACGSGYGAPLLIEAGARTYLGVDLSPEAISLAEERYRVSDKVRFLRDDACRLSSMSDNSIDVAVSFETVEHLCDPPAFLSNLARVLRPEGLLLISTPNRSLFSPGKDFSSKPANPFHLREWTQQEFAPLLGRFFEVKEALGQNLVPLWKAFILRQVAKNAGARWFLGLCVAAKHLLARPSESSIGLSNRQSEEVRPLTRFRIPVHSVFVAAPRKL